MFISFELARWQRLVNEANTSGIKKSEWCRINGVSTKQFYYWQKKVRAMALEEMSVENGQKKEGQDPSAENRLQAFVELRPPLYIPTEKISHHGQFDHQLR